ncbi:MAG TPA: hypothetical protein VN224_04770 [Xanthomonadales bacterium]|nr:hypothetical protein [Xanthomonadales bacterium]
MSLIGRARCLCDKAPVGALIGKLGGSTAGAADGAVFVVGSSCIVKVGDDDAPLYLTINDEESGMSNNQGSLKVKIEQRLT